LAVAAVIAADIALGPGPGALIGATVVAAVWSQARRRTEIEHDELVAELPELVELLALAIDSGLTIRLAVEEVARHAEGRLGAALREICVDQWSGRAVAAGLEQLGLSLGEPLRPLVAAMLDAERYGAPLGPTLARLGDDARIARRRRAEERSRRLPVRLLFPLVGCVLPAFVALTIAPVALATLARLRGA
jgi:tight adherence protein C